MNLQTVPEIILHITHWHWFILAAVLFLLDILLLELGTFFLWPAIAAVGVGALMFSFPTLSFEYQLLTFSASSVITVVIGKTYFNNTQYTDIPTLNRRGSQYIGRVFTLKEPIIDGIGKAEVSDGSWRVEGPNCPAGTQVKVIGINGIRLQVEIHTPDKQPTKE